MGQLSGHEISKLNLLVTDKPVLDTCVRLKRLFPYAGSYGLENLAGFFGIESETFHHLGRCNGVYENIEPVCS